MNVGKSSNAGTVPIVAYFSFIKSKRASPGITMPIATHYDADRESCRRRITYVPNFACGGDDSLDLRRSRRCPKGSLGGVGDGSKLAEIST